MENEKERVNQILAESLRLSEKGREILIKSIQERSEFVNQQGEDKTVEERALELYPELSSKDETYLRNNVDIKIQRKAYIKGATDNSELREAAEKVVMYWNERFHEVNSLAKRDRFNKAVNVLEQTLKQEG